VKNKFGEVIRVQVQWFSKDLTGFVTIYETNITLNTVAAEYFTHAYKVIIGYHQNNKKILVIKPLTKEETLLGIYKDTDLLDISIKPSYARINGKAIVSKISNVFNLDFELSSSYKFKCEWDQKNKFLIIHLDEVIT